MTLFCSYYAISIYSFSSLLFLPLLLITFIETIFSILANWKFIVVQTQSKRENSCTRVAEEKPDSFFAYKCSLGRVQIIIIGIMSRQESENLQQERQLKKEIALIMTSFEDVLQSYSSNRKELDQILNQLLKVYRTYKIYKSRGRVINKFTSKEDIYFEFCILNNISCCYATKKEVNKSCEYLKLANRELKNLMELFQKSELDYEARKIETINLHMRMIKIKLQLCGVFALNVQHVESLRESSQAFTLLENVINSVCDYSMGERHNEDFLELQKCISEPNTQISEKQIKNTYWNNIMNCQSDEEVRNIFLIIFKNFHAKEQTQARSCLGKIIFSKQDKVEATSADSKKFKDFSIVSVMKISPIMLEEFHRVTKKEDYTSLKFLHDLTILLSLTHFTVSTELRLSSFYDLQPIDSSADDDISMVKKEKRMIEAERHHFFAIEILYRMASPYVKQCAFFARLVKGYEEVYLLKDHFEIIREKVEEQNEASLLSIKDKGSWYDYKEQEDEYLQKMKNSKCLTPRSLAKKELRADLYRIRQKKQEEEKGEKLKNSRKTPSTHKAGNLYLSPRQPPKSTNKSKEKEIKNGLKKSMNKAVSPTMRKSRNQAGARSPHRDYTNYG